ncbi:hypothetical protein ACH4TV_42765 [Streptomyces sp. NPDC020898]|uniref:hypothetical protein n=1 Tax=Streptomyces sp. NPDC020898 TaxID=3365101 RepID=UPI0037B67574
MTLIEAMTRDDLTGPEFTDRYTHALHQVIQAKQEDRQPPQAPAPASRSGELVDLMATLQESVSKARVARSETLDTDTAEAPDTPAKKAPSPKASSRTARQAGGRRGTPAR